MIRVYTVAIPSVHCRRTAVTDQFIAGQRPAVLAAGTRLKVSDFRGFFFYFNGILSGN